MASLAGWLRDQLATGTTQPDGAPPRQSAPEQAAPPEVDGAPPRGIDLLTRVPELSDAAVEELLQKVLADKGAERELAAKEGSDDG